MAIENIVNTTTDLQIATLVSQLGKLGLWIQGIGLFIITYIIFQIVIAINNRIKRKTLYRIEERLGRVEKKIDKILSKHKK